MKVKNGFVIREICGEKVLSGEGSDFVNFNKLIRLNDSAAYLLESVGSSDFTEESLVSLLCGSMMSLRRWPCLMSRRCAPG